jgi:hypothetical protein
MLAVGSPARAGGRLLVRRAGLTLDCRLEPLRADGAGGGLRGPGPVALIAMTSRVNDHAPSIQCRGDYSLRVKATPSSDRFRLHTLVYDDLCPAIWACPTNTAWAPVRGGGGYPMT